MKFTKMQGIGNDYVYVNCFEEKVEDPSALAIQVSDRHFGIGSDGLILICPSEVADCEMAMYNADGSRGEMCGNGVRCVGKYMYDYGLTDKTEITYCPFKALTIFPTCFFTSPAEASTLRSGVSRRRFLRSASCSPYFRSNSRVICLLR